MRNIKWYVFVFEEKEKKNLLKILDFNTVKEIGYVFNIDSQIVSNYFHGLIKPRGLLQYCYIYQFKQDFVKNIK